MHALAGRKQSKRHIAKRMAAMKGKKRASGAGRPANSPEILWSKVDRKSPEECWPWIGCRNEQGYGRTEINDVSYYAHRVIFDLANPGVITLRAPNDRNGWGYLRHKCDNPPCCNPSHLEVGTHIENMRDKAIRGRTPDYSGGKGPRCKLTMEQAREIRWLRQIGKSARELAGMFKMSLPSIKTLLRGDSYKEKPNG